MTKRELELLGKAFEAEINGALRKGPRIFQTKSRLAKKLVEDGLLREAKESIPGWPPIEVKGYELTELGRLVYCTSCGDEPPDKEDYEEPR